MVTSSGIIVLSALLHIVLQNQSKTLALMAMASWLGEAMFVAVAQLGDLALVSLSQECVKAGAPANGFYQTLGNFLYG